MPAEGKPPLRIAGQMARTFINSKLPPLFIAGALLAGVFAILMTPREEEPQIVVPMLDVFVQMPGGCRTFISCPSQEVEPLLRRHSPKFQRRCLYGR